MQHSQLDIAPRVYGSPRRRQPCTYCFSPRILHPAPGYEIHSAGYRAGVDYRGERSPDSYKSRLSIDIDGIDWWLWRALDNVRPRVVITEFNHLWGPEASVTVPYDPKFKAVFTEHGSDYAGASLSAFVKLARTKGYRLVGTNRISTNALFVRTDLVHPFLPEVEPDACFSHPRAAFGQRVRLPKVQAMPWEQV
jgi:hypothetical protein